MQTKDAQLASRQERRQRGKAHAVCGLAVQHITWWVRHLAVMVPGRLRKRFQVSAGWKETDKLSDVKGLRLGCAGEDQQENVSSSCPCRYHTAVLCPIWNAQLTAPDCAMAEEGQLLILELLRLLFLMNPLPK